VTAAVSFDLDGTLWDFQPMMDGALREMLAAFERRRPELAGRLTLAALHEHRRAAGEEAEGTLEELRRRSLRRALAALDVHDDDLAEWLAEELLAARATAVRVHDDVAPAVAELTRRGYVVGAITNGNFPFARLPLARSFAFVVHAEQTGVLKPGAEPFAQAVELAGVPASRFVHVGDDPLIDVAGARAFGMRAVWLNRLGAVLPEGVEADAELADLGGLADLVDRLIA
jgi:putative hydrolase of the HAD superfamily